MQRVLIALSLILGIAAAAPTQAAEKAKKEPAKTEKAADKPTAPAAPVAAAPAAKEVTLTGTMSCGKCFLKETDACQNVLQVKDGAKEVKYFLVVNDVAKENHGKVCSGTAKATVTGVVGEDGGKKTLAASKIKYE